MKVSSHSSNVSQSQTSKASQSKSKSKSGQAKTSQSKPGSSAPNDSVTLSEASSFFGKANGNLKSIPGGPTKTLQSIFDKMKNRNHPAGSTALERHKNYQSLLGTTGAKPSGMSLSERVKAKGARKSDNIIDLRDSPIKKTFHRLKTKLIRDGRRFGVIDGPKVGDFGEGANFRPPTL